MVAERNKAGKTKLNLKAVKEALEDIAAAGDAARLQLHLLLMGVRDRKSGIESSLDSLEGEIDRGIEQAVHTAAAKTRQLTKNLKDFLGRHGGQQGAGVRSIMTEGFLSCSPEHALHQAAQIMWDLDCGAVPVLDADGRPCGILTDRDICMAAYTKGLPLHAIRVGDVMTRRVVTCLASDTLERAAALMQEHEVRRLVVTDADGRALGMLALTDVVTNADALAREDGRDVVFQLVRAVSQRRRAAPGVRPRQAAE